MLGEIIGNFATTIDTQTLHFTTKCYAPFFSFLPAGVPTPRYYLFIEWFLLKNHDGLLMQSINCKSCCVIYVNHNHCAGTHHYD